MRFRLTTWHPATPRHAHAATAPHAGRYISARMAVADDEGMQRSESSFSRAAILHPLESEAAHEMLNRSIEPAAALRARQRKMTENGVTRLLGHESGPIGKQQKY